MIKIFIRKSIIAFLFAILVVGAHAEKKPNIVLILADDLGYGDLGITGSIQIRTPYIDALANSGVFCSQGYVSAPVCSPSRAGIMTGRNQVSFGYDNNIGGSQPGFDPHFLGLPTSVKTIASRLKELEYATGLIGKWHLGDNPHQHPGVRGFDTWWTYEGGGHNYFKFSPDGKGYDSPIQCNYKKVSEISYITDDIGTECVDFIKKNRDEQFFLYASFNAPHAPMQATEEDLKLYHNIKDEKRRVYASMVHRLDVNVGRIVNALEECDIRENTLIVFLSDNGGPVFNNASINAPYRGHKGTLLEGGIHVPFILNWESVLPKGVVYDKTVSSLDLAPTFFAMANGDEAKKEQFDGVNVLPFLIGERDDFPHNQLKWRFTISASIRDGKWKLVRLPDRLPLLYDLSEDISELKDVALDNIEITKELLKQLGDWDVSLPQPLFLEGAIWKARQLDLYDKVYPLKQPK